jgi:hypothetical protein
MVRRVVRGALTLFVTLRSLGRIGRKRDAIDSFEGRPAVAPGKKR